MSSYRRSYSREDPRLNRAAPNASPKAVKSPSTPGLNNGQQPPPPPEGGTWNAQTASYNHTQALQNAYQSLPYHNTGVHQYPTQTYYTGYQNYSYNPYENYQASQQAAYLNPAAEPRPPGEEYPHGAWTPATNNYSTGIAVETPAAPSALMEYNNAAVNSDKKKTDAVAEEKIKQLAGLLKERETYEERVSSLKKKLRMLIAQKDDLSSKRSPEKESLRIIKENTKLQVEIQSKIKDATNVIDILSNLIGDKKKAKSGEVKASLKDVVPSPGGGAGVEKLNYKHFDPEIHWCRLCDAFPQSAKDLLLHLHSKAHQTQAAAQEEIPWHKLPPEPKFPTHEGAPSKRVPIKGLQFFVASTAWYCRLCDVWIGDLHCASQHLMSITHSQNYNNFVEQNPHWETEWLKDREKALDRVKRNKGDSDSETTRKRRDKYSPSAVLDGKKKKKSKRRKKHSSDESSSSSSSSSSSEDEEDKSKSIRVAMRNKLLETDGKLDMLEKFVRQKKDDLPEDKLLSQWMTTANEPIGKDKMLLDNLKEKLKQKQDAEKAKIAFEAEIIRRQRERDEMEKKEKETLEREAMVKEEEKKHREKMSMKLKQQPSIRDSYRRRSTSRSPDARPDARRRRSRSITPPRRAHRNGRDNRDYEERSPRYDRGRRSRSRSHERARDRRRSRSKSQRRDRDQDDKDKKNHSNKKLPFIGRMPLFKNIKPKAKEDEPPKREIQKEDYDQPRKTRFQPGNLARAFIPQPEVVCFPQLSSLPPVPPPPPPITVAPVIVKVAAPEAPKINSQVPNPKPPPAPKLAVEEATKLEPKAERALLEAAREEAAEEEPDTDDMDTEPLQDTHVELQLAPVEELGVQAMQVAQDHTATEDYLLYEDPTNTMYQYGTMNYNMMYPPGTAPAYNFLPVTATEPEPPKSHTLPLEPPPLPPDDPNEDLAMLGLSSDDMAVQQMF